MYSKKYRPIHSAAETNFLKKMFQKSSLRHDVNTANEKITTVVKKDLEYIKNNCFFAVSVVVVEGLILLRKHTWA